jgi:hypothetical protein
LVGHQIINIASTHQQIYEKRTSKTRSFLTHLHSRLEFLPQRLGDVLNGAQGIVEDVVGVLGERLEAEVHLGLGRVGDAVADELDVGVAGKDGPEKVSEGVILIVEDVGRASLVVLLLLHHQPLLLRHLLDHRLLAARRLRGHLLLLRHVVLRVRH